MIVVRANPCASYLDCLDIMGQMSPLLLRERNTGVDSYLMELQFLMREANATNISSPVELWIYFASPPVCRR